MKDVIEFDTILKYVEDRITDCKTNMSTNAELYMLKEDYCHRAEYWRSKNLLEAYENLMEEIKKLTVYEI